MNATANQSEAGAAVGAPVSFRGTIRYVTSRNEDSGFSVLRVLPSDQRMGDLVTVVGLTLAEPGDDVTVSGAWTRHPRFGDQVKADTIMAVRPSTPDAIERFLSNGSLPGIGPATAKRIVTVFGAETLEVLDTHPERLGEVSKLGPTRVSAITAAWKEQNAGRDVMVFLAGQGLSQALSIRIYKRYGGMAPEVIRQNPYRLASEVRGIGFLMADHIAMSLGVPKDSPNRIDAALRYVVEQATGQGHCGMPWSKVIAAARDVLELSEAHIDAQLHALLDAGDDRLLLDVAADVPRVFTRKLHTAETAIAARMAAMIQLAGPWPGAGGAELDALIAEGEKQSGMALAAAQRQAVRLALTRRVSILTGGPGTGKTSTLGAILVAMKARRLSVKLAAPTGKAAKRMREATGHDAQTVARLIGMGTELPQPIECDVLVIDEASMMDVPMAEAVLDLLDDRASLLLVGDVDQLPSVGPGHVLGDLIDAGSVPVTRLTQVFRQAAQSAIIRNAHRINRGHGIEMAPPEDAPKPDFYFIECNDPSEVAKRVVALVTQHIPDRCGIAAEDVQVLSPMRRTETGTEALNAALRDAINPDPAARVARGGATFGMGDKVLQIVNNYDLGVMNGESGVVVGIDDDAKTMTVNVDSKDVVYPRDALDQLTLAYAMTIHKSQGSQFPAVVIPVTTQHYMMLLRSILYTGVTRASKFCVLVGQRKALDIAIRNDRMEARLTRLTGLLRLLH